MENKEDLEKMVDALIKNKSEEAQIDFHRYLAPKMKDFMNPGENNEDVSQDDD